MKKKVYSSYDEIERDLEILDLERKLHYHKVVRSIDNFKDNFTFINLVSGFLGISKKNAKPLAKTVIMSSLPFLIRKLMQLFVKK